VSGDIRRNRYVGCTVVIADLNDNVLLRTKIVRHDLAMMSIEVEDLASVNYGEQYKLTVLTSPAPLGYFGKLESKPHRRFLVFREHIHEERRHERHNVTTTAVPEGHFAPHGFVEFTDEKEVHVVNVSISGIRFATDTYRFARNDKIKVRMRFGTEWKRLFLEIRNSHDRGDGIVEYGCMIISRE
jgi:hypothetical protein